MSDVEERRVELCCLAQERALEESRQRCLLAADAAAGAQRTAEAQAQAKALAEERLRRLLGDKTLSHNVAAAALTNVSRWHGRAAADLQKARASHAAAVKDHAAAQGALAREKKRLTHGRELAAALHKKSQLKEDETALEESAALAASARAARHRHEAPQFAAPQREQIDAGAGSSEPPPDFSQYERGQAAAPPERRHPFYPERVDPERRTPGDFAGYITSCKSWHEGEAPCLELSLTLAGHRRVVLCLTREGERVRVTLYPAERRDRRALFYERRIVGAALRKAGLNVVEAESGVTA